MELKTNYTELENVLNMVATSCGNKDRPILSGVFVEELEDGSHVFAGADGFTLAVLGDWKSRSKVVQSAVVTIPSIKARMKDIEADGKALYGSLRYRYMWEPVPSVCELEEIVGNFLNYRGLIPASDYPIELELDKLDRAVHILGYAASLLPTRIVKLEQIDPVGDGVDCCLQLSVSTETMRSELKVYVPAKGFVAGNRAIRTAIDCWYLQRLCKALEKGKKNDKHGKAKDKVLFYWTAESSPIVVTTPGFTYVCMPQFIRWD